MPRTQILRVPARFALPQVDQLVEVLDGVSNRDHLVGLHVDLSAVAFADIKALASLTLAVTALHDSWDEVTLIPPTSSAAAQFVRYVGFEAALRSAPDAPIRLRKSYSRGRPPTYTSIVPLTWLTTGADFRQFLTRVLNSSVGGSVGSSLRPIEVDGLSRILFGELVDNVERHSGSVGALVTAWAERGRRRAQRQDYVGNETSYFEKFEDRLVGQLHLFIGDRGIGIPAALRSNENEPPEETLARSLEMGSTSQEREDQFGVRGLYAVDDICASHNGLFTIRCQDQLLIRDHSRGSPESLTDKMEAVFPGTQIRIEMPLALESRALPTDLPEDGQTDLKFIPVDILSNADPSDIVKQIRKKAANLTKLVSYHSTDGDERSIATTLILLSRERDPAGIVAMVSGIDEAGLSAACLDANAELERNYGAVGACDPVLVIGRSFSATHWVGLRRQREHIGRVERGQSLLPNSALHGTGLIGIDSDGTPMMRIGPATVYSAIRTLFAGHVEKTSRFASKGSVFVSPELERTLLWVDVPSLLRHFELGWEPLARLITTNLEGSSADRLLLRPSLVYDATVPDELAEAVSRLIHGSDPSLNLRQRIRPRDVSSGRDLALDPRREVIVLVSAMLGGHHARAVVSTAMRQNRAVATIATVVDMRNADDAVLFHWGRPIGVASVHAVSHSTTTATTDLEPIYVDRWGRPVPDIEPPDGMLSAGITTSECIRLLKDAKAISYGHFAGSVDRHFTFYIDAVAALSDSAFRVGVVGRLIDGILAWCNGSSIKSVVIDYPTPEIRPDSAAHALADIVRDELTGHGIAVAMGGAAVRPKSNVVYISWGTLTGDSLLEHLEVYAEKPVRAVLLTSLICQLPDHMRAHFQSVRRVATPARRAVSVQVSSWFGVYMPVEAYSPESCPICLQLRQRSPWLQASHLDAYIDEERRLALVPWRADIAAPNREILGSPLPDRLAAEALDIRWKLCQAASSPRDSAGFVEDLSDKLSDTEWRQSLFALVLLEPQWLRETPLSLDSSRKLIAEAALLESTNVQLATSQRALALIALRQSSKVRFVSELSITGNKAADDESLFGLVVYLVATLLDHDYVASTDIASLTTDSLLKLEESLSAWTGGRVERAKRQKKLNSLIDRAAEMEARASGGKSTPFRLVREFSRSVNSRVGHRLRNPMGAVEPGKLMTHRDMLSEEQHWIQIRSWVAAQARPYVARIRRTLAGTSALGSGTELSDLFPDGYHDPLESIVDELHNYLHVDEQWSENQISLLTDLMSRVHYAVSQIFLGSSPLLTQARGEISCGVTELCQEFDHACSDAGLDLEIFGREDLAEVRVLAPDRWRRTLAATIVENAVDPDKLTDNEVRLSLTVSLSEEDQRARFEYRTYGTRSSEGIVDGDRSGGGGLTEAKDDMPEDAQMTSYPTTDSNQEPCFLTSISLGVVTMGEYLG